MGSRWLRSKSMRRVTSPGLPPSPRLYVDTEQRRATASARHPTWQSTEWAIGAVTLILVMLNVVLLYCLLVMTPWFDRSVLDVTARLVVAGVGTAVMTAVGGAALRWTLTGFLERQVFSVRTKFWFTADAIAFRSHLYTQPIVVWRRWGTEQVDARFIVQPDLRASRYERSLPWKRKASKDHLHESLMLCLLLTASGNHEQVAGAKSGAQRVIPITEVNSHTAAWFTIVCTEAVQLTGTSIAMKKEHPGSGVDVDLG